MKEKTVKVKAWVTLEVKIPETPNFIISAKGDSIPIQELQEQQLCEIGNIWRDELIAKARKRRTTPPASE